METKECIEEASWGAMATERLEAELCTLAAHIDAALCRFLGMVAEYDRRSGWEAWEARSCAHWLAWKCGISLGTAREHVRVAHALEALPRVRAAFAAGALSYSKVRALTRVARPSVEASLIEIARGSTATGLERICRAYRRHGDAVSAQDAVRSHDARSFTWSFDDEGSLVFSGRVAPEHADTVLAMISAARTALDSDVDDVEDVDGVDAGEDDGPAGVGARRVARTGPAPADLVGPGDTTAQRNADAFVLAAESFLVHGAARGGRGVELTVVVDDAVLRGGEGGCHVENGPALPSAVARRLACDAGVVGAVIGTDGDPRYVGRHAYVVNRRLRRALRLRDRCCRFPGCDHPARLEAHHLVHWADGGETTLENMVLLCAKHHHAVHDRGFRLVGRTDGALHVRRPDGVVIEHEVAAIELDRTLEVQHAEHGVTIDHRTNDCLWEGRTPNISDILCHLDTLDRRHQNN